jgi:hypothetical protein
MFWCGRVKTINLLCESTINYECVPISFSLLIFFYYSLYNFGFLRILKTKTKNKKWQLCQRAMMDNRVNRWSSCAFGCLLYMQTMRYLDFQEYKVLILEMLDSFN